MNKNGCLKVTFSKLNCEEISSIYLCCDECDKFDIPEKAEVISFCTLPYNQRCLKCCIGDIVDILKRDAPILDKQPDFPEYYISRARLRSFDGWPKTLNQTSEQLSAAGFFYTQKDDRVICFCCGGGLYNWQEQDDPWEQHALHYGHCDYLNVMKGSDYITSIKEKLAIDEPIDLSAPFEEQ